MKRILTTTTAFAVALASIGPLPAFAQVRLNIDGKEVVCLPNAEKTCAKGDTCFVVPDAPCTKKAVKAAKKAAAQATKDKAAPAADGAAADGTAVDETAVDTAQTPAKPKKDAKPANAADAVKPAKATETTEPATPAKPTKQTATSKPVKRPKVDETAAAKASAEAAAAAKAGKLAKEAAARKAAKRAADRLAAEQAQTTKELTAAQITEQNALVEALAARGDRSAVSIVEEQAARPKPKAAAGKGSAVKVTEMTAADTRSSAQEFGTAAAVSEAKVAGTKKDKLSDLEKFGLVVLGGLVVGALLKNGDKVVSNSGDRVVVQRDDGSYAVLKDDDTLIRQPGNTVSTESFDDGSTRTTVTRTDGSKIVTIRDASGRVLRRARLNPDGSQTLLIDDLVPARRVNVSALPKPIDHTLSTANSAADLRAALLALETGGEAGAFSLAQVRDYPQLRALAPTLGVENVTFETGSAAIRTSEAARLARLGHLMRDRIAEDPSELFLIEGHSDAVGGDAYNLALSDRRAESLALALTEYFRVPPENMVVQGYGESELLVDTPYAEPFNRRTVVRLISPLLQKDAQN